MKHNNPNLPKKSEITKAAPAAALLAIVLSLGGCADTSDNAQSLAQPADTFTQETELTVEEIDLELDVASVIENAETHADYAVAPTLADLHMAHHPLDIALYQNQNGGNVANDGSRVITLGWVGLDPNAESADVFNRETAVRVFLSDTAADSHNRVVDKFSLPGTEHVFSFDADGQLISVQLPISQDVKPSLQEQLSQELSTPVVPNNTKGHTLFSMAGVDLSGNGTIDVVVPVPITDYTIDLNSPNKTVYTALKDGETLWDKVGMGGMRGLDNSSYADHALEHILAANPAISSERNIPSGEVLEIPTLNGLLYGP